MASMRHFSLGPLCCGRSCIRWRDPGVSIRQGRRRPATALGRACLVAILLIGLPAFARAAEGRPRGKGLFSPVAPSPLRSAAIARPDAITIRRREVTIDLDRLQLAKSSTGGSSRAPAQLTLNLFEDTVLTAVIVRADRTSSGYSLEGRIEGVKFGTLTSVVNGTVVAGSARTPLGAYRIRSSGKRLYSISEVDESKSWPAIAE